MARLVYLACDKIRTPLAIISALAEAEHRLDETALTDILQSLVADKLMLEDKGLYLSLAYRAGRHSLPPPDIMAEVVGSIRNRTAVTNSTAAVTS